MSQLSKFIRKYFWFWSLQRPRGLWDTALNSVETDQILHHQGLLQKAEPIKDAALCGKETLSLQNAQAAFF